MTLLLKILRIWDVEAITGVKRTIIYEGAKNGSFPKPIKILGRAGRASGWLESEVMEYLAGRVQERDQTSK